MSKKLLLAVAAMLNCVAAIAQLSNGYYRIQNYGSGRYMYVRDCTGNVSTLGADMGSLELWPNLDNAISDPGSIIYAQDMGSGYDLTSQGTGVYDLTGRYMNITVQGDKCMVYNSGQYLYEVGTSDMYPDMGLLGAKTAAEMSGKSAYRLWLAKTIDSNSDNYFGFKPTITANGKYYTPFFANFAYTPKNGQKSWYVSQIDKEHGISVIKQIEGTVAKAQPVIVECKATSPSDNRVELTTDTGNSAINNLLTGVYFSNGDRSGVSHTGKKYPAVVPFDANIMRVLGTDSKGNLAFVNTTSTLIACTVKQNDKWVDNVMCIPHNQFYLTVDADCPATLQVMTEAEYAEYLKSLVTVIGEANLATNIQIGTSQSELGTDILTTGGKDRAKAIITYDVLHRKYMSDGSTYSDNIGSLKQTVYGQYIEGTGLDTLTCERTLLGNSQPTGTLLDASGNKLYAETTDWSKLTDCVVNATSLPIYQQANKVENYSDVHLELTNTSINMTFSGGTSDLSTLASATQTATYTSKATRDINVKLSYILKSANEGISLEGSKITAAVNESSNQRYAVITVIATGEGGKSVTSEVTLTQAAKPADVLADVYLASDVQVDETQSDLGTDIPAAGGKDRASAKVTYKIIHRTFKSDGTYTDETPSAQQEENIYGNYVETAGLDTLTRERTLIGKSQPSGNLTDKDGNLLYAETTDWQQLIAYQITGTPLDIYQQANLVKQYSDVTLQLKEETINLAALADTINLSDWVIASQLATYTSQASRTIRVTISYSIDEPVEGITLADDHVYLTANETEASRQATITVSAKGEDDATVSKKIILIQTNPSGINSLSTEESQEIIYDLTGKRYTQAKTTLPRGIYVINHHKYIKR